MATYVMNMEAEEEGRRQQQLRWPQQKYPRDTMAEGYLPEEHDLPTYASLSEASLTSMPNLIALDDAEETQLRFLRSHAEPTRYPPDWYTEELGDEFHNLEDTDSFHFNPAAKQCRQCYAMPCQCPLIGVEVEDQDSMCTEIDSESEGGAQVNSKFKVTTDSNSHTEGQYRQPGAVTYSESKATDAQAQPVITGSETSSPCFILTPATSSYPATNAALNNHKNGEELTELGRKSTFCAALSKLTIPNGCPVGKSTAPDLSQISESITYYKNQIELLQLEHPVHAKDPEDYWGRLVGCYSQRLKELEADLAMILAASARTSAIDDELHITPESTSKEEDHKDARAATTATVPASEKIEVEEAVEIDNENTGYEEQDEDIQQTIASLEHKLVAHMDNLDKLKRTYEKQLNDWTKMKLLQEKLEKTKSEERKYNKRISNLCIEMGCLDVADKSLGQLCGKHGSHLEE